MGIIIKNGTILSANDEFIGDILIEGEKIIQIGVNLCEDGHEIIDATGKYVFPGGVDEHVHMGSFATLSFETSHAALVGGTTTIVDFAPQIKGKGIIESVKIQDEEFAKDKSSSDYSFHGMVMDTSESLLDEIPKMVDAGITTLKFFMAYKYTPFMVPDDLIFKGMQLAKKYGITIMVHAENGDMVYTLQNQLIAEGKTEPVYHAYSRPPIVEDEATQRAIYLAELAGCPLFVVHVSSKGAMEHIKAAHERGLPIYGETCTHYLTLNQSFLEKPNFEGAKYVCSPALRTDEHLEAMWDGIKNNYLLSVGSDHAAVSGGFEKKKDGFNNFAKIPNGCPSVQDRLAMIWTQGVEKGKISRQRFVEIFSTTPAKIVGLYPQKGVILPGSDADIVIYDPSYEGIITHADSYEGTDYAAFEGFERKGIADKVFLRGKIVAERGKFVGEKGKGQYIKPKAYALCYDGFEK
ncbi:MAG: dihydropyrimidinase [Terrisporobacter othiniensis]|uniref:dihydropyrimidinase n=1 Tax=Terrisporobacter othiniensis TaxID=1577792 RepID=UPI002909BF83|nr:dihydropyrimidinase [Terrisporobacter othiniensis]MDU6985499.1 dihydropyrimidinase [Terrisporobacter othiniensis]